MGVAVGLLSIRGIDYPQRNSGIFRDISPWTWTESREDGINEETNPNVWASRTDRGSLILIFLIIFSTVVSTFHIKVKKEYFIRRNTYIYILLFQHLHPYNPYINVHSQLFFSHLQLVVILGLTKDEGKSLLGKLCRGKLVQILGDHSMATYMLHDDVQKLIIFHAKLPQVLFIILYM